MQTLTSTLLFLTIEVTQFNIPNTDQWRGSTICRPVVRAVILYLWRHRAQSTMVWSSVFWRHLARTFAKFSVNFRRLNLPEHRGAQRTAAAGNSYMMISAEYSNK